MSVLRRPGSPWRILVHEWVGTKNPDGLHYGKAYDVTNDPAVIERQKSTSEYLEARVPGSAGRYGDAILLEGTEFDELVIGKWIHLEQMNSTQWWMNVGGVTINVTADRDGRPKRVDVYGPGDYDEPVKGCKYECTWSLED